MKKVLGFTLLLCVFLAGCIPEAPLKIVIKTPQNETIILSGIVAPKMDYSATFSAQNAQGLVCKGATDGGSGFTTIVCTNGITTTLTPPHEARTSLNGAYHYEDNLGNHAAVGWGNEASEEKLTSILNGGTPHVKVHAIVSSNEVQKSPVP